jgi:ABC-type metal ion transport system, periplasmic component/surface adhesin
MKQLYLLLFIAIFATSCNNKNTTHHKVSKRPIITVTIEPLRYFTEAIAGNKFKVVSMVPKGVSPETYDPTPQQLIDLTKSKAFFRIGYIGFEQTWMDKLTDNAPHLQFFDTSKGVELIYDNSHPHLHGNDSGGDSHTHLGVEPHIWSSTYNAQIMAVNILNALCTIDKNNEEYYLERYKKLSDQIKQTDSVLCQMLSTPGADRSFMIYHPALSYFARDYGLHQIAIESGGKEPSPAHLKELIQLCKKEKVRVIFVQPEFDRRNADIISRQTGAKVVPMNPLSYDWEREMLSIGKELRNPINNTKL